MKPSANDEQLLLTTADPYSVDGDAQFVMFAAQFAETASLVRGRSEAEQRMALIAVDHLAEVLLHRHLERIRDTISRAPRYMRTRRFGLRERARARADFSYRVNWSTWDGNRDWWLILFEPLLVGQLDQAIFRVAHRYRNRVYHADHHNPAVLPFLNREYLKAVGRAFVRTQQVGLMSSRWPTSRRQLRDWGYEPSADEVRHPDLFEPRIAARSITAHLTRDLDVRVGDAIEALQTDLEDRALHIDAVVRRLGLPQVEVDFALHWGEFWDRNGECEAMVRLDDRRLDAFDRATARGEGLDARTRAAFRRAEKSYATGLERLAKRFRATIGLSQVEMARRRAGRLSSARDLGRLLTRYRELDEVLDRIERALEQVAVAWDERVQREIDYRRGK